MREPIQTALGRSKTRPYTNAFCELTSSKFIDLFRNIQICIPRFQHDENGTVKDKILKVSAKVISEWNFSVTNIWNVGRSNVHRHQNVRRRKRLVRVYRSSQNSWERKACICTAAAWKNRIMTGDSVVNLSNVLRQWETSGDLWDVGRHLLDVGGHLLDVGGHLGELGFFSPV